MSMKTAIDIEALLVWAYRDMRVERLAGGDDAVRVLSSGGSNWGRFEMLELYGAFIQSSPRTETVPCSAALDLENDALLVHRRVLELDDAFLEMDGDDAALWDRGLIAAAGHALVEPKGGALHMVAPGGDVVWLDRIGTSVLLIQHARAGIRPECHAEARRRASRPRRDTVNVDPSRAGRPRRSGELAPGVTYATAIYHRAQYSVWHAALGILAAELAPLLLKWEVTGPHAPESPWLEKVSEVKTAIFEENYSANNPMKSLTDLSI